jgi:hypothetical protein
MFCVFWSHPAVDGLDSFRISSGSSSFESEGDERIAETKEACGYVKRC